MDQATKKRKSEERKIERRRIGAIKGTKPVRDPAYLAWLRTQRCVIGEFVTGSESCITRSIEAAHTGVRGLRQRASDLEALPMCVRHHRTGPDAHHVLGKRFFEHHGIERETMIEIVRHRYLRTL